MKIEPARFKFEQFEAIVRHSMEPDDIFDVEFGNRTYYVFYDLEDGNYLATDKKLNVYSLVHDARPATKKLKCSLAEILTDIETKAFHKDKHLEERYKTNA